MFVDPRAPRNRAVIALLSSSPFDFLGDIWPYEGPSYCRCDDTSAHKLRSVLTVIFSFLLVRLVFSLRDCSFAQSDHDADTGTEWQTRLPTEFPLNGTSDALCFVSLNKPNRPLYKSRPHCTIRRVCDAAVRLLRLF